MLPSNQTFLTEVDLVDVEAKLRLEMEYLRAGIVPFRSTIYDGTECALGVYAFQDVNRYLDTLPPDEARAMKRKFRKLWRRAVVEGAGDSKVLRRHAKKLYGLGNPNPEKKHKLARKSAVIRHLREVVKTSMGEDKVVT